MWVWGCWFLYGLYIIVLEIVFNECGIVLCACYLSPETSTWGMDADLYFNHLSSVVQSLDEFTLGENVIEQIDQYRYLGCTLSEHVNYKIIGIYLSEGAGRALGKLGPCA